MKENFDQINLIKRAQQGDKQCMERLIKLAEQQLRVSIYRLTLQNDLTDEIVQETILKMIKVLAELKEADRFWPWLFKIAVNKMRLHHRTEQSRKTVPISALNDEQLQMQQREGVSDMVSQELKQIVFKSMGKIRHRYRTILGLRCYNEMEYSEIAQVLGISEFAARMLFCRAKKALKKQLAKEGFSKGSLLMALTIFGMMTTPTKAATVSISATTLNAGTAAGLVCLLTGKSALVPLTAAGLLGLGTLVVTSSQILTGGQTTPPLPVPGTSHSQPAFGTANQYWYYYPAGPAGPVMTRIMQTNKGASGLCRMMQDEQANYVYDNRRQTLYINNYRNYNSDLSVMRLPTDPPAMRQFLSQIEQRDYPFEYVSNDAPGLMAVIDSSANGSSVWTTRHFHVLKEEYFQSEWPNKAKVVDNRDQMHKRGWTNFTIEGHIGSQRITGQGRIPFVYATASRHWAWMKLWIGNKDLVDTDFAGLSRPWMGLHTIDTIRRDAARDKIPFETINKPQEQKVEIKLTSDKAILTWSIDMGRDLVEKVIFSTKEGKEGELRFNYLQNITETPNRFIEPKISSGFRSKRRTRHGILWPIELIIDD